MRRDIQKNRKMQKANINKILYTSGGIISLIIIIFVVSMFVYGNKTAKESSIGEKSQESLTILAEGISTIPDFTKEASSSVGKSVNEVKEESNALVVDTEAEDKNKTNEVQEIKEEKNTNVTKKSAQETTKKQKEVIEEKKADPVFTMPVEGDIIKEYAKDKLVYSDTLKEWVTHAGIDIKAEKTAVVKASEEGKIKSIKNDPRYGLTVVIEHNNGYSTVYSNLLTAEFIQVGEAVKKGQTIATVGNTATFEISDEPHLHFEILKDNVQIDPNMYIK